MKIFVAGASGAMGKCLVPMLVTAGHKIVGSTRTPAKVEGLRLLGAEPVVVDGLDRNAVLKAVESSRPEVIVHQMTALASMRSLKRFDEEFRMTNRLRTQGTEYLLRAARASGVAKFVAQSYTGWPNDRRGSRIKTEDDPLDRNAPKSATETMEAIRALERMVLNAQGITGIALRYGSLYGPGTSLSQGGEVVEMVRRRKFPLVGSGAGVWSFIHIDDAARATRLAIERGPSGLYNIVDDDPVEARTWLPYLAEVIRAKPPRHLPAWLARFAIGEMGVLMMTETRGSSNAKAKRTLGWQPLYASWRDGFRHGLAGETLPKQLSQAG